MSFWPMELRPYRAALASGVPRSGSQASAEEIGITADTALRLAKFFGTTVRILDEPPDQDTMFGWPERASPPTFPTHFREHFKQAATLKAIRRRGRPRATAAVDPGNRLQKLAGDSARNNET